MKKLLNFTAVALLALGLTTTSCDNDDDGGGTTVIPVPVDGGVITGGSYEFMVGDGIPDTVPTGTIMLEGNTGSNSTWVVTDVDGTILGLPPTLEAVEAINFDGSGDGSCFVWHLSYEGNIVGAEIGNKASDLSGNLDLSNSIEVVRTATPVSIAQYVTNNPNYSMLLAAVVKAELDGLLADDGTFTVFAPDNAAFMDFLNGDSLDDVPVPTLTNLLLNHVFGSITLSTALENGYVSNLATYGDTDANLSTYINIDEGVKINGISTVAAADIMATNGVIHAVDAVIPMPTIVTFATADPTFGSLVDALTIEGLTTDFVAVLGSTQTPAPFTVFAPTDVAFGDVLTELGVSGLADIETATLEAVLGLHVIAGANVRSDAIPIRAVSFGAGLLNFDTMSGVAITTSDTTRKSMVVATDVQASNGVIHAIDKVLLP